MGTGEIAGICASLTWAVSSLVYSRAYVPAGALNLFKNCAAAVLFLGALAASAVLSAKPLLSAGHEAIGWLVLSGAVGIVVGDTCYFRSMQILGARRALVLSTFAPPLAGGLGWIVLDETLSKLAWAGMLITLAGVAWVVTDARLKSDGAGHYPGTTAAGVAFGFMGSLCQAIGGVLSKLGMDSVDALEASFFRLVTAAAIGLFLAGLLGRTRSWSRSLFAPGVPLRLAGAAGCGTFLGIWLSLVAYKHTHVAIATTLTALSPIFVMPIARVFLGWTITPRALLGALVAVGGVLMMFD